MITTTPVTDTELQKAMEATEHLDRPEELEARFLKLLAWPPLEMVEASLAAEVRGA